MSKRTARQTGKREIKGGTTWGSEERIYQWIIVTLQVFLVVGAILAIAEGQWMAGVITLGVVLITFLPVVLSRRFRIRIPPEFHSMAVVFIYASLFLGEVRGYYARFWWWDVLLHISAGFLLGILGFLMVHVLNEKEEIEMHMNPGFVAFFSFMFAIGLGALWEIFEFGMDQVFGLNMQKSGLMDTMWDLIVDGMGALVISLLGWSYLRQAGRDSFLERWIDRFIKANPQIFRRSEKRSVK